MGDREGSAAIERGSTFADLDELKWLEKEISRLGVREWRTRAVLTKRRDALRKRLGYEVS
jgi:hypothetical protein